MASAARILTLFRILLYSISIIETLSAETQKKVCYGTNNGMSITNHAPKVRHQLLVDRYRGCSYVFGNLEIVYYNSDETRDMSFLRTIEEVTGYVLIMATTAERIPLNNLRIIRGRTLFTGHDHSLTGIDANRTRNYSLYVAYNYVNHVNHEVDGGTTYVDGLTYLVMPKLTEILAGSVLFHSNPRLCFLETIDWSDILSGEGAKVIFEPPVNELDNRTCGNCPVRCEKSETKKTRHCWTRQHCQHFTRILCAKQCSGRCFGKDANQCCHTECAAGCTGPNNTDCLSCKNFINDGLCVPYCPQEQYDPESKIHVPNPNAKYTYGSQCVKECPHHMLVSKGACVSDCGKGYYADDQRKCVECTEGLTCPKRCNGTGDLDWVNAQNIKQFIDCKVIQGCLKIQRSTFNGDLDRKILGLKVKDLSVFENIVEITDYLRVDADSEEMRNLTFLRNLKWIQGRNLENGVGALTITGTKLESLELNSLREVRNGKISIHKNPKLCYADSFNWHRLLSQPEQKLNIQDNRNASECESNGFVCSGQCTSDGCMGPLNDQCFNCSAYRFGSKCLQSCDDHRDPYLTDNGTTHECLACHEQCLTSCRGLGSDKCDACRYYKDDSDCVSACPRNKYTDKARVCHPCHPLCLYGCLGPDNTVTPNGCVSCDHVLIRKNDNVKECIASDTECPMDYYSHTLTSNPHRRACVKCHDECLTCTDHGADKCQECRRFQQDETCVSSCSADSYSDGRRCYKCHEECSECLGPTASDCKSCRVNFLYEDFGKRKPDSKFNCTSHCPTFAPYTLRDGNKTFCVSENDKKLVAIVVGTIFGGVVFIGFVIVVIMILRRQVARAEEKKLRLTAKISGLVECEPLTPSSAKPDMAFLRLIKESDLRRSGIIGSGAFGTVYKGLWIPEGENIKIPVAIKVLQEGAGENENLLEEARIMASVVHPCCLHILAVCLTAQMMLVSQLMPLGCLLDYVRKHRDNIGSKVILNWCTQIARGMSYLEERGFIHRDLAARNVLVHSPNHVKITDFGLAKLVNEDRQFLSTGGKLPIKWLALECIRNRIFTHKSDVWSFGVTVWELCTYGQRPYENVSASDIVYLLEKGERLPQPSICTIDVYMIMIKCWMLGAESRPSFSELAEEFAKMARDPGRYLVISNDKLMRLPSHPADFQELLRNVSLTLDGPEEVVMADEYVNEHAKKTRFRRPDKPNRDGRQAPIDEEDAKSPPATEQSPIFDDSKNPESKTLVSKSPNSRFRLVPRLELACQNRLSGAPSGDELSRESPRYSPDPCSISYQSAFPATAEVVGLDGTMAGSSPSSTAGKKKVSTTESVRLALDGSDYLQPKSSSTVPASYLELVDYDRRDDTIGLPDDINGDSQSHRGKALDEKTSLLQRASSAIENPEYFQPTNTTPLLIGQNH